MRTSSALLALALAASCAPPPAAAPAGPPARPQRVVSLDYCADQFVLKLADRAQIAALSPDAGKDFSFMRAAAAGLPSVRARAEDVLALRPDLVVRAYGGGPGVEGLLARAGVAVVTLGVAEGAEGVRANVRAMAQAFGHPARGEALVAAFDARMAAARRAPGGLSALYVTPSGVTAGPGAGVDRMMRVAGLGNLNTRPGWSPLPLERLARDRPDVVVAADFAGAGGAIDRWSPARHPVLAAATAGAPAVRLDGALTACGGWFMADAVHAMAEGHDRARAGAGR